MSYENKILQLKSKLGKKKSSEKVVPTFTKPTKPSYCDQWKKEGLEVVENDFGIVFKRQVRYPKDYVHGSYPLSLLHQVLEMWEHTSIDHPYAIHSDEHIVFFDTETTGLKGVGTHIFLCGFLEMDEEEFVLTQFLLADPSNEAAFLFESKLWKPQKTLVTYNGKSFDWPQVETRWTLNRQFLPKLQRHRQVDLLHSSKRLWKNNMEKMKLTAVEEEKLGFKRKNDIPGFLAPIIYADAIKSGEAQTLMKVLYHNEWDLLSLITLYIHSTKLLLERDVNECATTYTNIGKWYGDLKQNEISKNVLTNTTETFHSNTEQAYYYLAFQQKRNGQYTEAVESFKKAIACIDSRDRLKAIEQLSMIHEHQLKDFEKALQYAKEGINIINKELVLNAEKKQKQLEKWQKRIHRVQNKMGK